MSEKWKPVFKDWSEGPVTMSTTAIQPTSSGRSDAGVFLANPDTPYKGDGAIFCVSKTELYLRYNWQTWYPVQREDPVTLENIYKRHTASLSIVNGNDMPTLPIPVYHVDKLPDELFAKPTEPILENLFELGANQEGGLEDDDAACTNDKQLSVYQTTENVFLRHYGVFLSWLSSEKFDFHSYACNNAIFLVVFFTGKGDWAADEDPVGLDDWACWYGPDSCRLSPVDKVQRLDARFHRDVHGDYVTRRIVVLNNECNILNPAIKSAWDKCDVEVVTLKSSPGSSLPTLADCLERDALFNADREVGGFKTEGFVKTVENFDLWHQEGE